MSTNWIDRYDDEIQEKINWIRFHRMSDLKKLDEYCQELLEYAKAEQDNNIFGSVYFYLGEKNYIELNHEQAIECFELAYLLLEHTPVTRLRANACNALGGIHMQAENYEAAMDCFLRGLAICKENSYAFTSGMIHCNMAELYTFIKEYESALLCLNEAWDDFKQEQEEKNFHLHCLILALINKSQVLLLMDLIDEAKECIDQAEELFEQVEQDENEKISFSLARAIYATKTEDYDSFQKEVAIVNESFFDTDFSVENLSCVVQFIEYCYEKHLVNEVVELQPLIQKLLAADISNSLKMRLVRIQWELEEDKSSSEAIQLSQKFMDEWLAEKEYIQKTKAGTIQNMLAREKRVGDAKKWMIMAEKDALTNLWNRRYFETLFERRVIEAAEKERMLTVGIMDVDFFKEYNDHYGHMMGDECLNRIAGVLSQNMDEKVCFARYGGDEFVFLAFDIDESEVRELLEQVLSDMKEENIVHEYADDSERVTMSIGAFIKKPLVSDKINEYIQEADKLLYEVKRSGKTSFLIAAE